MTINQARKLLGKKSEEFTDDELGKKLTNAELFKDLFFYLYQTGELNQHLLNNHNI